MRTDDLLEPFCSFSPNSKFIVSAYYNKAIIWSASSGQRFFYIPDTNRISYCCFSPCGKFIASSSWEGKVKIWEMGGLVDIFKGDY
jgi:WD40 repeat protein